MQARAALPLHRLHDEEVVRLLESGERRQELTGLLGADGYRELSALAREAAATRHRGGQVVYVLPGLMGSRIGTRGRLLDDVIWLDPIEVAAGHLTRLALPRGSRLSALGVMLLNALKLRLTLQIAGFDARFHAYDWRRSVERLADELLARIESDGVRSPMLVGHSMGGVVIRVALAADRGRIARVVQLGAPNSRLLRAGARDARRLPDCTQARCPRPAPRRGGPCAHRVPHAAVAARIAAGCRPHRTQPNLFDATEWPDDALRPDPELLAAAASARRRWPRATARCLHVVGVRARKPYARAERPRPAIRVRPTPHRRRHGAARARGEPGSNAWYAARTHGGLPNNGRVISAVVDLLRDRRHPAIGTSRAARARAGARP